MLGKEHGDKVKLTQRIQSTGNTDGSYNDTVGDMRYQGPILGTTSALSAMAVMSTLSSENKTSGLAWLSSSQLDSGGFGLDTYPVDIVGKTKYTCIVAECLNHTGETSGSIAVGIEYYIPSIETELGFEGMELIPSIMWASWLSKATRYAHAGGIVDYTSFKEYLGNYEGTYSQFPAWANLSIKLPPEYDYLDANTQYMSESVWTQYFGVSAAQNIGLDISSLQGSAISGYIKNCQYPHPTAGHFKPSPLGTAHMQYSVAAVEALYLLDELGEITWTSWLETAILSEYSSGQWDSSGWTLKPFLGQQSAIDYLSTRTALRLDLVTLTMAEEIESTINSRVQYTDLWALSRDVATMSCLINNGFSVTHEIDDTQVMSTLGSNPYSDGWYNSTSLYQPIYTADILEMISILGLRPQLSKANGTSISCSIQPEAIVGENVNMDININSTLDSHTIYVTAFDQCLQFDNVANSDTLVLPIPADYSLGPTDIRVMIHDFGMSRGFNITSIEIWCTLEGVLSVETSWVLQGELINGTVSWSRFGGEDAGSTHIVIALEGEEWSFDEVSPFSFSLPSNTISEGKHNLTVNLTQTYSDNLELWEEVTVAEPDPTYILSPNSINSPVNQELDIPWSLHFQENGSFIPDQNITLEIQDSAQTLVHTDYQISTTEELTFQWTPTARDDYSFKLIFNQNSTLEYSEFLGTIHVSQNTSLDWILSSQYDQYQTVSISARLTTDTLEPLSGETIFVLVTSPALQTVIDSQYITNSTGHIDVTFILQENGVYILDAYFAGTQYLNESDSPEPLLSWSSSSLSNGGIPQIGLISEVWNIWAKLEDSQGNPVTGQSINITITYLPSTIVKQEIIPTNSSGYANLQWQASSVGDYLIEVEFEGTLSRGTAYNSSNLEIRALVSLTIIHSVNLEVGLLGWICVNAEDDFGPLSGLEVWISVHDPYDVLMLEVLGNTVDGKFNTTWTPTEQGWNNVSAWSEEQSWYEAYSTFIIADVYEQPAIEILLPNLIAPDSGIITISVVDVSLAVIPGVNISISMLLNSQTIFDEERTTDALGTVTITIGLDEPGQLSVEVVLENQGWLLSASKQDEKLILGRTDIELNLTGFPIDQGTALGIIATISAWDDSPLLYSNVTLVVLYPNGTIINLEEINSTSSGSCLLYHEFNNVGDFNITAIYEGDGLQEHASKSMIQRVHVIPTLYLIHDSTGLAGESVDFSSWICDAFGVPIQDRVLNLTIWMNTEVVHTIDLTSSDFPTLTSWTPSDRGIATVTLTHVGDGLYLTNSTQSTLLILDLVEGEISVSAPSINLFEDITITYTLSMESSPIDIPIIIEILGPDLVTIWYEVSTTNESGIAELCYFANHSYGQLKVKARPSEDEYLTGGDIESDFIVMTQCVITGNLAPSPPIVENEINITISGIDELGGPIDGLSVRVYLWDPNGDQIKLGFFSQYISKTLEDGNTWVEFTPDSTGYYTINVTSSGSTLFHGFIKQFQRIVYCSTSLNLNANVTEIAVNDGVSLTLELIDVYNNPLDNKIVTLTLDGPYSQFIGPLELTTNSEGVTSWEGIIDEVGLWIVEARFSTLGVYLGNETLLHIDAIYGTRIGVAVLDTGEVIANINPVSLTVYLEDSAGNPLEGRTINYEIHHDVLGKVGQGSLSMSGALPEPLNITFIHMGNHTVVFSYIGTIHYRPSNMAIRVWTQGTTSLYFTNPNTLDRSDNISLVVSILDEIEELLSPNNINMSLLLSGPNGKVNLTQILDYHNNSFSISLFGLEVGEYHLNISVLESYERLGSFASIRFNVTAQSKIIVQPRIISGITGDEHTANLTLVDSYGQKILDSILSVSLYDPEGREIYGSILRDRTIVPTMEGSIEISWLPQKSGVYTIYVEYEGIPFIEGCNKTVEYIVRYSCTYNVLSSEPVTYPDSPSFSYSLISSTGGVSGAAINITIIHANGTRHWFNHFTDSRGNGKVVLDNMHAGFHEVFLNYSGSEEYTSCWISTNVTVKPDIDVKIKSTTNAFTGVNCTLLLVVNVSGVERDWNGSVQIHHTEPSGVRTRNWLFLISRDFEILLILIPEEEGEHSLDVFLLDIPIISNYSKILGFMVSIPVPSIPMDVSTTPVTIVGVVLPLVAVALKKRMNSWLGSISGEWEE